jgi:hypothetical protein
MWELSQLLFHKTWKRPLSHVLFDPKTGIV